MFLLDALLANGFDVADPADATTYLDVKKTSEAVPAGDLAVIVDKLLLNVKDATGAPATGHVEAGGAARSARSSGGGGPG